MFTIIGRQLFAFFFNFSSVFFTVRATAMFVIERRKIETLEIDDVLVATNSRPTTIVLRMPLTFILPLATRFR